MNKIVFKEDVKRTRLLLTAGLIAGILFVIVPMIEMSIRPGFDIRVHAISMLSLGDLGWIQITTFIISGLLTMACAAGMRRVMYPGPGGTWGPFLIALYGFGMIVAGVFSTDPSFSFPPGAPQGMPATMSSHAILHSIAFFLAFTSLPVACFVFSRWFVSMGQKRWVAYSITTGLGTPLLIAVGMAGIIPAGVAFFIAGIVVWLWVIAVTLQLLPKSIKGES